MPEATKEIKLFYSYAHKDKALREELEAYLITLKRQYNLTNWSDREILAGEEWAQAIDHNLSSADLILLLISPDFIASDYCYGNEMQMALERQRQGTCRVVPILIRPTAFWEKAPFSFIQMLPTGAKPITSWSDRDEAFYDIVEHLGATIEALIRSRRTKEEWLNEAKALYNLKRYEEALNAYDQAIRLDPNMAVYYHNRGNTLQNLGRFNEAEQAHQYARQLGYSD